MMSASDPRVTNELLSAYIDEAVSEEERRLIESAVAQDPEVAWRLESLRATVRLLHELPEVALPRSFLLTPKQVAESAPPVAVTAAPIPAAKTQAANVQANSREGGFWQEIRRGWQQLWQGGSPALRNAMAASFAVLLALLLAPRFLAPPLLPIGQVQTTAAVQQEATAIVEPYSATAEGEAATAQIAQMEVARGAPAAEPEQPEDTGAAVADTAAAKESAQAAPAPTDETALAANEQPAMEADSIVAEDAERAISLAAAEAEAPAEAAAAPAEAAAAPAEAAAAPTVVPAAVAAASAREMAQDPALAQPAGGSSILDEMQRQAGGGAPGGATGDGGQDPVTLPSAAPPDLTQDAAAEAVFARQAATDSMLLYAYGVVPLSPLMGPATVTRTAEPTFAPLVAPTAAIVMAPAEVQTSEQVQAVEPAAAPVSAVGAAAWQLPALQGGALLAGVATVVFGLLWWRSRR